MKRILSLLIAVLMTVGGMVGVNAYSYTDDYYRSTEITVKLNGSKIYFDQPPIMQNNRTLVPMRKIFEAMGFGVEWDEDSEMIDVWSGYKNIMTLWVGFSEMWTPEKYITLDAPPVVVNDRTLVPVRAISESVGAIVDWDDYSQTVIITYNASNNNSSVADNYYNNDDNAYDYSDTSDASSDCKHKNTMKIGDADSISYKDIDSPDVHNYYVRVRTKCTDCGETIDDDIEEKMLPHNFENGICTACGYMKDSGSSNYTDNSDNSGDYNNGNNTNTQPTRPSSDKVTYYIDGAFMHIAIPAGKSIEIPNSSNGSLKIQMDGVYNVMERKVDGTINAGGYNTKSRKSSFTISKNAKGIVQNSGNNDLIVSIPSDFASYNETYEKVYERYYLSQGDSVLAEPTNNQKAFVYYSNRNFEWIKYDDKSVLKGASQKEINSNISINKNETAIITATSELELYFCPAMLTLRSSASAAFTDRTIGVGQTVRIYAPDSSNTRIYVEQGYVYDYVTYGSGGNATSQRQNKKAGSSYQALNKGSYTDITNTSTSSFTIKIPSGFGHIE